MSPEETRTPTHSQPGVPRPTRDDRLNAAAVELGLVAGMGGYWAWFATSGARTSDDPGWVQFEKAFPLAGVYLSVMAACCSATDVAWRALRRGP